MAPVAAVVWEPRSAGGAGRDGSFAASQEVAAASAVEIVALLDPKVL